MQRQLLQKLNCLAVAGLLIICAKEVRAGSDVHWIATNNGNWSAGANWSGGSAPASGDNVFIDADGTYTVTLDVTISVGSLTIGTGAANTQTLSMSGNTLTLTGAGTVAGNGVFTHAGGTFRGAGTLTVQGVYNWNGGTIADAGSLAVAAAGTLNIGSAGDRVLSVKSIDNAGTINWTAGRILGGSSAQINNSALFEIQCDNTFDFNGAGTAGTLNNLAGATLRKRVAAGITSFNTFFFTNSGTLDVQSGVLNFAGPGTSLLNGTLIKGAGILRNSTTVTLTGTVTLEGTYDLNSGILNGAGTLEVSGTLNWNSTRLDGPGVTHITPAGTLNINTGSDRALANGKTVNNDGTILWTNGRILGGDSSVINNNALFSVQCDRDIVFSGSGFAATFNNLPTGIFRKTVTAGTTTFSTFFFNNNGLLDAQSGSVNLSFTGTSGGLFQAADGAAINFTGNTNTLNDGTQLKSSGTGIVRISGGTVSVPQNASVSAEGTFELLSGTLNGAGTFNSNGTFNWNGGTIAGGGVAGAGVLEIPAGSAFKIGGAGDRSLSARVVNNRTTVAWTGSGRILGGDSAVFNNYSVFEMQSDAVLDFTGSGTGATFNNRAGATLRKVAATGVSSFNSFFLQNSGTIDTQAGTISLNSVTHTLADGTVITGAGVVRNNTTVTLSGGTVTLDGTYELNGGVLNGAGKLEVNGTLNWNSTRLDGPGITHIAAGATFNINTVSDRTLANGKTINNDGTILWTNGRILGGDSSVINNSALFSVQCDRNIEFSGGGLAATFNNLAGATLRKTVTTGTTAFNTFFLNNNGLADVQTGSLNVNFSGSGSGHFQAASGAAINFTGGTQTLAGGVRLTSAGSGLIRLNGGTLTVPAAVTALSDGTFEFSSGTLTGPGAFKNTGAFTWNGGTMSGSGVTEVEAGSTFTIGAAADKTLAQRTINNRTTSVWIGTGRILGGNSGVINNYASFEFQNDAVFDFTGAGSAGTFNNLAGGTIRKKTAAGVSSFNTFFLVNNSTIDVQSGAINLNSVNHTLGNGTLITGGGLVRNNTTVTVPGTATVDGTYEIAAGNMNGAGTFVINGILNWNGGRMDGPGITRIAPAGRMNIANNSDRTMVAAKVLNNEGTVVWTDSGRIVGNDNSTFNNTGTVNVSSGSTFVFGGGGTAPTFNNYGIFAKSGQGTTTTFSTTTFNNLGILEIQSGTVYLNGGFPNFSGSTLTGGTFAVVGTLKFNGANVVTNASNLVLDGPDSAIINGSNANGIANFVTNAANGSLTLRNGRALTISGGFTNAGSLMVASGATLATTGANDIVQTGGITSLSGGTIAAGGSVNIQAGVVGGIGTLSGSIVTNSGEFAPGSPLGTLSVNGNYAQTSTGQFSANIGGTAPGLFDSLEVSGFASLNGTLNVSLLNNFNPGSGDSFEIVSGTTVGGIFSLINGTTLGGGRGLQTVYNPADVTLQLQTSFLSITSLQPDFVPQNNPAFTLTVNGTNFSNDSVVRFNGLDRTTTFVNATRLDASIPASDLTSITVALITVFKPGANGGASNPLPLGIGNHPPVAGNYPASAADQSSVRHGGTLNGTLRASDPDNDPITFRIVGNPGHGNVSVNANSGVFTYTAHSNFAGIDSFVFVANDGFGDSNPAFATLTVANLAPVASNGSLNVDTFAAATGSVSATDADGDTLTYQAVANPAAGSLTLNSNGSYIYTPAAGIGGTTTFTFKANDGLADSNAATVTITLPKSDLSVASSSAPAQAFRGGAISVTWTIANNGIASAQGNWTDKIYLSDDTNVGGDIVVGAFPYDAGLATGTTVTRIQSVTIPGNIAVGNYHVVVITDADNSIPEGAGENNNSYLNLQVISIQALPQPELIVESLEFPPTAVAGQTIDVAVKVKNVGTGSTSAAGWFDRVFLSFDNLPDGADPYLGGAPNVSYLAPGDSYINTISCTLPNNQGGSIFIVGFADKSDTGGGHYGNLFPGGVLEVDEDNNFLSAVIVITLPPLPDLQVPSVTGQENAFSGEPVTVHWTVQNKGDGAVPGATNSWTDAVYLSQDDILDASDPILGTAGHGGVLEPGAGYSRNLTCDLPNFISGDFYLFVKTDVNNNVFENNDEDNNFARAPIPIHITLAPPPDLIVTSATSPTAGVAGQTMNIGWTIKNQGAGDAAGTFRDTIYLSTNALTNTKTITLLNYSHGGLAAGASLTQSGVAVIPGGTFGTFYLFVETDSLGTIAEFDPNLNAEGNNTLGNPAPIAITTPPVFTPNLQITNVTAPASGVAGQSVAISWTVTNTGDGPTLVSAWTDRVYLSTLATLDGSAVLAGSFAHGGVLSPAASYSRNGTIVLPPNVAANYFVFVVTDADGAVAEGAGESDNVARSAGTTNTSYDPPDLQVSNVAGPAAGNSGATVQVSWTVTNLGTGPTQSTSWMDSIYLSTDPAFSANTDLLLSRVTHIGNLAVNGSYAGNASVHLPAGISGSFYFIVFTDSDAREIEGSNENNNTAVSANSIAITRVPAADLVISDFDAPNSAQPGETIQVSWSVVNFGDAATPAPSWRDTVYLSSDAILDSLDLALASVAHTGALGTAENYPQNLSITLPKDAFGSLNFILHIDSNDEVIESNESNNTSVVAAQLPVPPPSDLQISNLIVPATGTAGQTVSISWNVKNISAENTNASAWTDVLVFSRDQVLDTTDPRLAAVDRIGVLAAGDDYTRTMDVGIPPSFVGPYYVFVRTDVNGAVNETTKQNNTTYAATPISIIIPPPADLVVTTVAAPAAGSPGRTAAMSWTVQNDGAFDAVGSWSDALYLSADGVWDVNDAYIGTIAHNGTLTPAGSYTQNASLLLPAVTPAQYYVLVRTDIRNNLSEAVETNNTTASIGKIDVDAAELTLGTPASGQLSADSEDYYKVLVPEGETVSITLSSGSGNSANELYVRFGEMPTRSRYDYVFSAPFMPDQQITIPETRGGYYYILARGDIVPNAPADYVILAKVIDFSIQAFTPDHGSNRGQVTVLISGAKFTAKTTATLIAGPVTRAAKSVYRANSAQLWATFDLRGLAEGPFFIRTDDRAQSVTSTDTFAVTSAPVLSGLKTHINAPEAVRTGRNILFVVEQPRNAIVAIEYENEGDVDVPAPLFNFTATNCTLKHEGEEEFSGSSRQFLGINPEGPAGIVPPGMRGSISIDFMPSVTEGEINFELRVYDATDVTPMDWASVAAIVMPVDADPRVFQQTFNNLVAATGSTYGDYVTLLDRIATEAAAHGERTYIVSELFGMALEDSYETLFDNVSGFVYLNGFERPLGDAFVVATENTTGLRSGVASAADGSFSFFGLPPGNYSLSVENYLNVAVPPLVVGAQPVHDLELIVKRGGAIEGTVRDAGNKPVEGVTIFAIESGGAFYNTKSAGDGSFAVNGLLAGTYDLTAVSETGLASQTVAGITLTADEVHTGVIFSLSPPASVSGTVTNKSNSAPLANALVILQNAQKSLSVRTNASGQFQLTNVPPGQYVLRASAPSFVPFTMQSVNLAANQVLGGVQFQLEGSGNLTVTVTDAVTASPIKAAYIKAQLGPGTPVVVFSGADGRASFSGLPAGTYSVFASAPDYLGKTSNVVVTSGGNATISAALDTAPAISGKVTLQPANVAAVNVEVVALAADGTRISAVTDTLGIYRIADLPLGQFAVFVSGGGNSGVGRQGVTLSAANLHPTLNFTITGASLSGTLTKADGSASAGIGVVSLVKNGESNLRMLTDLTGHFSFLGLSAGTYQIEASGLGGAQSFAPVQVTLVTGEQKSGVIVAAGNLSLTGTVRGAGNAPVKGATVFVTSAARLNKNVALVITAVNGTFHADGLPPGQYTIIVNANGYVEASTDVTVAAGTNDVQFDLAGGHSLTVLVAELPSGNALGDASVIVMVAGDAKFFSGGASDNSGSAVVRDLPDGNYDVLVSQAGHQQILLTSVAISGSDVVVNAGLLVGNTQVSGRVVDSTGAGLAGAVLSASDSAGRVVRQETVDFNGSYSFTTLIVGNYTLRVYTAGFESASVPIALTAGQNLALEDFVLVSAGVPDPSIAQQAGEILNNITQAITNFIGNSTAKRRPDDDLSTPPTPPRDCCPEAAALYFKLLNAKFEKEHYYEQWIDANEQFNDNFLIEGNLLVLNITKFALDLAVATSGAKYLDDLAGSVDRAGNAYKCSDQIRQITALFGNIGGNFTQLIAGLSAIDTGSFVEFVDSLNGQMNNFSGAIGALADFYNTFSPEKFKAAGLGKALNYINLITDLIAVGVQVYRTFTTLRDLAKAVDSYKKNYNKAVDNVNSIDLMYRQALSKCKNNECPPPPPPPPPDPGAKNPDATGKTKVLRPTDPNEKRGPAGFGPGAFVSTQQPLPYTVFFENVPDASAPAQRVTITDNLDPNLDVRTFRLGMISFGDFALTVPDNRSYYQDRVQLGEAHGNLVLDVVAGLDIQAHRAFWILTAVDPATGDRPFDPALGLLPPNDDSGRGSGFVSYTISAKSDVATGTTISNTATIIFEELEHIDTNTVDNKIDSGIPHSAVDSLPETLSGTVINFNVSWLGEDGPAGSGIKNYDVFVADNDGAFALWQNGTSGTSALFEGHAGHKYAFYSVARDNAGNTEAVPAIADAVITITGNVAPTASNMSVQAFKNTPASITLIANDPELAALTFKIAQQPANGALSGTNGNLTYTPHTDFTGVDTFTFIANDGESDSNVAIVNVAVSTANAAPSANTQSVTLAEDDFKQITLSGDDGDADVAQSLTFSIESQPAHGTLSDFDTASGTVKYTPNANYNGPDAFTFKVADDASAGVPAFRNSAPVSVDITVTSMNDAPVATDGTLDAVQAIAKAGTLSASDIDGNSLTYMIVTNPTQGTATITNAASGAFTYTANANATGTDTLTFKVNDGAVDSNVATVTITIQPTPPVAPLITSSLTANATEGQLFSYTITATGTAPLTFTAQNLPAGLSFSVDTISGTPTVSGTFTIALKASNAGGEDNKNLVLTIQPVGPVAPLITSPLTASAVQGQAFNYTITATGTAPLTFSAQNLPAGLAFSVDTISGTPTVSGVFTISLGVSNAGGPDSKDLVLTITHSGGGNQAPTFVSAPMATPNPARVSQSVTFSANATDPDGDTLSYSWDFGDGAIAMGSSVQHAYQTPGVFTVTVTVSDGVDAATANFPMTVTQPPQPTDFDVVKAQIKFNFKKLNLDGLTMSGTLPIPQGFMPSGKTVDIMIGGFSHQFTLDKKAKAKDTAGSFSLSGKSKNGSFLVTTVKFKLAFAKQALFEPLKQFGFTNDNIKSVNLIVPVNLSMGGTDYLDNVTVNYKAKLNVNGTAVKK